MNATKCYKAALVLGGLALLVGSCRDKEVRESMPVTTVEQGALHQNFSGDRALAHVEHLVNLGERTPGSENLETCRRYSEAQLAALGWVTERQTFQQNTPRGMITFSNVIARFGPKAKENWMRPAKLLIGSHIDTKFFDDFEFVGANDSGSSTGALIELGRVLAQNPAIAEQIELVFFDGEEAIVDYTGQYSPRSRQFDLYSNQYDGLYGSRYYAKTRGRKARAKMGIILDMIGDKDLRIEVPSDSPRLVMIPLMKAAQDLKVEDYFGVAKGPILDDHVPLNAARIPTIDIIDMDFKPWHTPGDTLDTLSPKSLEIVGQTVTLLIENYLFAEE